MIHFLITATQSCRNSNCKSTHKKIPRSHTTVYIF